MKKIRISFVALMIVGVICFAVSKRNHAAAASQPPQTSSVTDAPASVAPETLPSAPESTPSESVAQAAVKKAANEKKHLFLFVSENDSEETETAKRAFEAAATKISDKAELAFIKRDSAAEKDFVEKYQLNRAPMPIVLVFAPNEAITGAYFGDKLKDPQLQDSIASESEQQCMKALQDGKLVCLCAQNATTTSNDTAMQGVNDFKADTRFAQFTEVVTIDPAAAVEQSFLTKLKIDPKTTEAITALLAPPGTVVVKVAGATTKDALVSALMAASSGGCGPKGCGPSGCGPSQ